MVTLLQLSSWSPGELPHPTSILSLVELLSKTQRNSPSRHTTIICRSAVSLSLVSYITPVAQSPHVYPHVSSDGVGRTGTFICLHSQLERLKTEGVVDFFQAVKSARIQRAGLVPDAVCTSPYFLLSILSVLLSPSHI